VRRKNQARREVLRRVRREAKLKEICMNQPNSGSNQKMVSRLDASPVLAALLTLFAFNTGHVYNGQIGTKWPVTTLLISIGFIVGSILCGLPGLLVLVLSIIDSYQTAGRLRAGEAIAENEYSLSLLYQIVKFIDKTATCSAAGQAAAPPSGKCPSCGEQNPPETKFCCGCGNKLA
jgi:hypothetical protein